MRAVTCYGNCVGFAARGVALSISVLWRYIAYLRELEMHIPNFYFVERLAWRCLARCMLALVLKLVA
jgi:hypothetical protein